MAEAFIFHVLDDRTLEFRQTEPIMLEDNNVTEFIFRIPKTLNELDVSSWSWWFVYKNANGDKYSSPLLLTDDADEPDLYSNATYWVDHGFTQKAGRVKVALEALNIGTGDAPTNEWHTKTYIIDVNDTLQGNQIEFKPSEVDIISGMLQSTLNQIREMIETGGVGGGTSDDIENASSVTGTTVSDALDTLSDEIASLSGGAPTPAATVSAMVDTTKIYLYTGSETGYNAGHWYYYSGGQWVDGGQYGEAASMSAGVKAALLACFRQVAWIDANGQTYYENLYNELYPPASLVSITAIYTQSGTVYDTASLDDLKPDLVVTANYSDSTSETVSDYTLSGTLAVGTSTVTVSYGGKTATFNVTVTDSTAIQVTYTQGSIGSGNTDANRVTGVINSDVHFDDGETLIITIMGDYSIYPFGVIANSDKTLAGTRHINNVLNVYAVSDSGFIGNQGSNFGTIKANGTTLAPTVGAGWKTSPVTYTYEKHGQYGWTFTGLGFLIRANDESDITPSAIEQLISIQKVEASS